MNPQPFVQNTPRVLIINPNTNRHVTDSIQTLIHHLAPAGVVTEVTSPA